MNLQEEYARWKSKTLEPSLKKYPDRKPRFETSSGLELPDLFLPPDPDPDYMEALGFPGEFPYTRGVQPGMYRSRLWTMRQYAGFASAEDSNRRYRYLLDHGQTGLSVAFDLPTQIGYDADDPLAHGEVGKVGVSISSLRDMETLFHDIPLERVSTSMTINAPAGILLAMYIAVGRKQGVEPLRLRGTIQNDILKEYIARGTYIFPPAPSMRLITDIFQYCARQIPDFNTISVSGYHMREAGSTAAQELAFTLSNGIAYVEAALQAGLQVDDFAPQISFFFNAHNNLLEEIAKFRAARRLWSRIMRERFNAQKPSSWQLRFHTQTAGSTLTAQQPENNVVRVTLQALAAVLGGTQSLHTNSRDEALWLPTENAVRLALRTQQIIAYESGVADTVDPLAGSYLIERLTDELEAAARTYIGRIDALGGALPAIERGYIQGEIQDAAYAAQQAIERGEQVVVGVNRFQEQEQITLERLRVDPSLEAAARERLRLLREQRDNARVAELRAWLEAAARRFAASGENDVIASPAGDAIPSASRSNMMPLFIECVEHDVTLGEICNTLRGVWGEYQARGF